MAPSNPARPSILVFFCDQLRIDLLGCYGGHRVRTPRLDGGGGGMRLAGTAGSVWIRSGDSFHALKEQFKAFVAFLRTGQPPFPFSETEELMSLPTVSVAYLL